MTLRRVALATSVAVLAFMGLLVILSVWMGALFVPGMHHAPVESDLLINVNVASTNPLILSVRLTWNSTDDNVWLTEARILDANQTVVAVYQGEWVGGADGYRKSIRVLQSFGEQKQLTMGFNTSLPAGDYALWFCTNSFGAFAHADFAVAR